MTTIWKYQLSIVDECQVIEMPVGAEIVHVDAQCGAPCMWVLLSPEKPKEERRFVVYGTGHKINALGPYVGTVLISQFVWHIFETF